MNSKLFDQNAIKIHPINSNNISPIDGNIKSDFITTDR
jgi:hypothetical protein